MLNPLEARELVHLLILRELLEVRRGAAITLKGGVNLRLFHGSIRYSEDIDLDGDPAARLPIRERIRGIFGNPRIQYSLRNHDLRGLDPTEGVNKDTPTTYRYKFHVLGTGNVPYPTKVEVSFREPHKGDETEVERPDPRLLNRYLGEGADLEVPHYKPPAAIRQKIEALATRAEVQARDVFDLRVLVRPEDRDDPHLISFLADGLTADQIGRAYDRTFELSYPAFEGQVVEFLDEEGKERFGRPEAWADLQIHAGYLIDQIEKRQRQHE
jgi:hypothetical protein